MYKFDVGFAIVQKLKLKQNFPTPFIPYTIILFSIKYEGKVAFKADDAICREIETIIDEYKNLHIMKSYSKLKILIQAYIMNKNKAKIL